MQYFFDVEFLEKKQIGKDIYEVILSLQKGEFHFKPGQYIWLTIPKLTFTDAKGNRRAFSISSVPDKNRISLIVKDTKSGYKNSLLNLNKGEKLQVAGPFGSSFILEDKVLKSNIVFIAKQECIAPFLSILRCATGKETEGKQLFLLFFTTDGEIFYKEEFENLESQNILKLTTFSGNFSYQNSVLEKINLAETFFFINGDQLFVSETVKALTSKGVKKEAMVFGENYPVDENNLSPLDIEKFVSDKNNLGFLAIEQSNHHITITDVNGIILFANDAAQNITGYTKTELLGNTPRLWGGIMGKDFYKNLWERLKNGKSFIGQMTNRRKNGQPYHTISNIAPIINKEGSVKGFIDTEEDITQQVFFEEHLRLKNITIEQEHQRANALLESLGEGVIAIDLNGIVQNANPTAVSMLGFTEDELLGKPFADIVKAENDSGHIIPKEERGVTKALTTGKKTQTIHNYIRKDGSKFAAGIISSPIIVDNSLQGIITVFRDVTKEEEIDRAKTEFISLASHQLRTPLSAVKWFLGMLLGGDAGKLTPEQNEMMRNVYKSNERMIDLVNSLLNVSRIESGRIIVDPVPTDMKELLDGIKQDLFVKLGEKNQKLTISIEENLPKINLDPLLIRQVYINLLTNALKYSPENTEIILSVAKQGDGLLSFVKDKGYGIPIKEKDKVFTKLYRGENVVTKVTDGNGLGLYLAKQIIESSKGKIWFDSEENKGTTFWFTLPISGMQKKEGEVKLNS